MFLEVFFMFLCFIYVYFLCRSFNIRTFGQIIKSVENSFKNTAIINLRHQMNPFIL